MKTDMNGSYKIGRHHMVHITAGERGAGRGNVASAHMDRSFILYGVLRDMYNNKNF